MNESILYTILGLICATFSAIACFGLIVAFPHMSGWKRLSQEFAVTEPCRGEWQRWQSAKIGRIRCNRCLDIAMTPEYLYLSSGAFRFLFGPPLQIPWSALEATKHGSLVMLKRKGDSNFRLELSSKSFTPSIKTQLLLD